TAVHTQTNNHFLLIDHLLFSPFFSWSQFKQYFNPVNSEGYISWLMAQRLSLAAFAVHGLEVKAFKANTWPLTSEKMGQEKICLGEFEKNLIKNTYWTETVDHQTEVLQPTVIQYTHPQAGVVASTIQSAGQPTVIHYPINPQGLAAIEQDLRHQLGQDYATINRDFASQAGQLL
ncbi:hypothetical protein MNBD_GAMMA02-447, partial [hydrothermal vent metagenome]